MFSQPNFLSDLHAPCPMAQHSSMHPPAGTPGVTRHHSAIRQTHITAGRPYPPPFHRTPGPSQAYEFGPGNLSTPVGAPMFGDDTGLDTGSPRLGGEGAFGSQYSASPGSPFMQPTDFQLAAFVDQIANLCGHSEAERLALHEISQVRSYRSRAKAPLTWHLSF